MKLFDFYHFKLSSLVTNPDAREVKALKLQAYH